MLLKASNGIRGRVIDLDTGEIVSKVISLNTDTGYLEAYRVDENKEILKDSNGNYILYSAIGRFKFEPLGTYSPNNPTSSPSIFLSEKNGATTKRVRMGAPNCAKCSSPLTLMGDDLCPRCRAADRGQRNKMIVERLLNPLLDRKCEKCSRLATYSVSDEVIVTPQRQGKVLYDRGMTVGRRWYCHWHFKPPRILDAKGEVVENLDEAGGVRPQ